MTTDDLDLLLDQSTPETRATFTPSETRALIRATRREATPRAPRVMAGATLAAILIGGGAAAFASDDLRAWFTGGVEDPYVTYTFTAPTGARCTVTSGDPLATDATAADALRSWLATADLMALIDVDAALSQLRSSDEHAGVGSDAEYGMAVEAAVVQAARAELQTQGFAPGAIDAWKSEMTCTEPTP